MAKTIECRWDYGFVLQQHEAVRKSFSNLNSPKNEIKWFIRNIFCLKVDSSFRKLQPNFFWGFIVS